MNKIEIWKDIQGYENYYQVSNLGNVKSLKRTIIRKNGRPYTEKEKILRQYENNITGFNALPGGYRKNNLTYLTIVVNNITYADSASFQEIGLSGYWWSS